MSCRAEKKDGGHSTLRSGAEKQNGTRNRTGNAYRNSARDGLSVIAGSRASGGAQRSSAGERAGQQGKNSDGLENLELWEISRESDDSRMMRLANREQIRFDQRRTRPRPQPGRQNTGNPRPVSSIKRRRAKKRRLNVYRISIFLIIGVCLILIYQTIGAVYRMVHNEEAGTGKGIVEVVSEKIEANRIQPPPIIVDYLEPNDFSRPGTELKRIKSVFVHYTANPGTSAAQNRSYFANLAETKSGPQVHILLSVMREN